MLVVNNKHMHYYDDKSVEYRSFVVLESLSFYFSQNLKCPCKESSSSFGAIYFNEKIDNILLLW